MFENNDIILFQGDSITDGNRGRSSDPNHILGHGYCFLIAALYGNQFANLDLTFVNRGVSGDRIKDLKVRWQDDCIAIKPTVVSILIGINDALKGTPIDQFEADYDELLKTTLANLPTVKVILCEPFTLPTGDKKKHWPEWSRLVYDFQAIITKMAAQHQVRLVRLQEAFDNVRFIGSMDRWIWDGIHPTYMGHQIIADQWRKTLSMPTN